MNMSPDPIHTIFFSFSYSFSSCSSPCFSFLAHSSFLHFQVKCINIPWCWRKWAESMGTGSECHRSQECHPQRPPMPIPLVFPWRSRRFWGQRLSAPAAATSCCLLFEQPTLLWCNQSSRSRSNRVAWAWSLFRKWHELITWKPSYLQ